MGAYATSQTTSKWVNVKNSPGQHRTYQLWIGDKANPKNKIDITPADNSAGSVAAAINAAAGDKVRATVIIAEGGTDPDYRISLQSTTLGAIPLDIMDGTTSLQTQQVTGALASYVVNGAKNPDNTPRVVTSTSRAVPIATGLTVNLLSSADGTPVNITVTRSTSALSDALTAFAAAYNDTVTLLDQQRGMSQGALRGQSIVYDLREALSSLGTYTSSGNQVGGLSALGLSLEQDGTLTFNSFALMAADITNSAGVTSFFGSAKGGGFLKAATDILAGVENSSSGILKLAESSVKRQIDSTNSEISDKQAQIDDLQMRLLEQMSSADAAIASMEQQYSYLFNMFSAMQSASDQYK